MSSVSQCPWGHSPCYYYFWFRQRKPLSINGGPNPLKTIQPFLQRRTLFSITTLPLSAMSLGSCKKPVPSVAAAPSPAPLPALDRFIPAKGADAGGEGQEFLQEAGGAEGGVGGGAGCSKMKASTADVNCGWGCSTFWCTLPLLPTVFFLKRGSAAARH